jgi:hypothetical protein
VLLLYVCGASRRSFLFLMMPRTPRYSICYHCSVICVLRLRRLALFCSVCRCVSLLLVSLLSCYAAHTAVLYMFLCYCITVMPRTPRCSLCVYVSNHVMLYYHAAHTAVTSVTYTTVLYSSSYTLISIHVVLVLTVMPRTPRLLLLHVITVILSVEHRIVTYSSILLCSLYSYTSCSVTCSSTLTLIQFYSLFILLSSLYVCVYPILLFSSPYIIHITVSCSVPMYVMFCSYCYTHVCLWFFPLCYTYSYITLLCVSLRV